MDPIFVIAIIFHVLPAVFWAGATFVVARGESQLAAKLFGPQMGAATVTVVAGAVLWFIVYGPSAGSSLLSFGAACAIVAAGVQGVMVGRNRSGVLAGESKALAAALLGNRIAALLLAVAIVTMVIG